MRFRPQLVKKQQSFIWARTGGCVVIVVAWRTPRAKRESRVRTCQGLLLSSLVLPFGQGQSQTARHSPGNFRSSLLPTFCWLGGCLQSVVCSWIRASLPCSFVVQGKFLNLLLWEGSRSSFEDSEPSTPGSCHKVGSGQKQNLLLVLVTDRSNENTCLIASFVLNNWKYI